MMIRFQPRLQAPPETVERKQPLDNTGGLGRLQPPEQEVNGVKTELRGNDKNKSWNKRGETDELAVGAYLGKGQRR